MKSRVNIMWFRRDLRLHDNVALYYALQSKLPVIPIFIFARSILDKLPDTNDRRVAFIYASLQTIQCELLKRNSTLEIYDGYPIQVFTDLTEKYTIEKVFANHDYEPNAIDRDTTIENLLARNHVSFHTYKDQVIFEKGEVVKEDGKPYTIFTPYSKKWKAALTNSNVSSFETEKYFTNFYQQIAIPIPSLNKMGFNNVDLPFPSQQVVVDIISEYTEKRNFPGLENGTSKLGVHLRFGTISIRELVRQAFALNETYLNELIWRDFYHMILWHFPQVGKGKCFKPAYEMIEWRNNEDEFLKWCEGKTGYPIVDAGMHELNVTGFMHNRVRMITASFLTKHLLIDWRWGEAYFAQKLLDFDLASNNGGWQWASSSGCDSAPYFRVFNPYLQTEKFDKELTYIKKWVPDFLELTYPKPIVEHEVARKRVLEVYAKALREKKG